MSVRLSRAALNPHSDEEPDAAPARVDLGPLETRIQQLEKLVSDVSECVPAAVKDEMSVILAAVAKLARPAPVEYEHEIVEWNADGSIRKIVSKPKLRS